MAERLWRAAHASKTPLTLGATRDQGSLVGIGPVCSHAVGTRAMSQAQRSAALQNIFFMGDFNADCSYVTAEQWPSIRLRSLSSCEWLIPDSADTTVTSTDCAYDRWVAQQWARGLLWGEQQVLTPPLP